MTNISIYQNKIFAGVVSAFISGAFENLAPLVIIVAVFEVIDFVTGVMKSAVVAKRSGEKFAFESVKAWRTIYKCVFILVGIVMAEMLDSIIVETGRLRLANYFAGGCCGVEFWSFLENAAVISDHPIFRWLRKFMKFKVEDQMGMTFEDAQKPGKDEICASCRYNAFGTCTLKPKDLEKCPLRNEETRH